MAAFPEVDVMISFVSLKSANDSTLECLEFKQIRTITIIPENYNRKLIKVAKEKKIKESVKKHSQFIGYLIKPLVQKVREKKVADD